MHRKKNSANRGFTLFELMLVISIIGIVLAMVLPRAQRAQYEATFGLVRQNASETGAYVSMWAQGMALSRRTDMAGMVTPGDVLLGKAMVPGTSDTVPGLAFKYTGSSAYKGVAGKINSNTPILNPFNGVSIFDSINDDPEVPGSQPGLLYLAAASQKKRIEDNSIQRNIGSTDFYFIFTGKEGKWYDSIHTKDLDGIRRGIFVGRYATRINP